MNNQDIKNARQKLGLTQKELALKIGVDTLTVSRWERGEQRPSQLARKQLAKLVARKGKVMSAIETHQD